MKSELESLGEQFGAAKSPELLRLYASLFSEIRFSVRRVLEFGVGYGGSLKMWAAYLPNAWVIGVDPEPLTTVRHSQIQVVRELQEHYQPDGTYDLIVDDGAHVRKAAETSLLRCWPHLRDGGWYCIEDWGTGYWPDWPDGERWRCSHRKGLPGLVKDLVDCVGIEDVRKGQPEAMPWGTATSLQVWRGLAVLRK